MERVGEFYKVSFNQFKKDYEAMGHKKLSNSEMQKMYDDIKLPQRATTGSAGYDFYLPFDITLKAGEEIFIPSGIRMRFNEDYGFLVFSKSGLGTHHRLHITTCISLFDSDYYYSDNEGHFLFKIIHDSKDPNAVLSLPKGKSFLQGVLFKYGITESDHATGKRNGGIGSTK